MISRTTARRLLPCLPMRAVLPRPDANGVRVAGHGRVSCRPADDRSGTRPRRQRDAYATGTGRQRDGQVVHMHQCTFGAFEQGFRKQRARDFLAGTWILSEGSQAVEQIRKFPARETAQQRIVTGIPVSKLGAYSGRVGVARPAVRGGWSLPECADRQGVLHDRHGRLGEDPRPYVRPGLPRVGVGDGLRYELVDGEPRAMAPASTIHGFLQNELGSLMRNHLRERGVGCEVLANPGVIPHLLSAHNVRVPDSRSRAHRCCPARRRCPTRC